MFCSHHFGKVEEDGFQYCKKCGKAYAPECPHKWNHKESINITQYGKVVGKIYVLECKNCGAIKQEKLKEEILF